jgi:hypothetical protein
MNACSGQRRLDGTFVLRTRPLWDQHMKPISTLVTLSSSEDTPIVAPSSSPVRDHFKVGGAPRGASVECSPDGSPVRSEQVATGTDAAFEVERGLKLPRQCRAVGTSSRRPC